jgi:hypothetical protein
MASRLLNRRKLRQQADQAAPPGPKAKAPAARVRKARPKKAPPRMCARWGVFDGGMKQVAIFDYNQRGAAEKKLADLLNRKKGVYFLQVVKEPMPEAAPPEAPSTE